MKKYLYLLTALCAGLFASCEEEGGSCDSCLTPPAQEQLNQKAFANDETTGEGFTFAAANVWRATVKETFKPYVPQAKANSRATESLGNNVVWLRLLNGDQEAYTGGAGEVNLKVDMDQNYTGEDREAVITITSGKGSFSVTVKQEATKADGTANEAPVKVTEIRLNKESLTLVPGEEATLTATALPTDATIRSVTWSCQDSTVAMVHPVTGRIIALGSGTTQITATSSSNKSVSASCQLVVEGADLPSESDSTEVNLPDSTEVNLPDSTQVNLPDSTQVELPDSTRFARIARAFFAR